MATDPSESAQHLADVGRAWSELASTLGVASVSFADTAAAMRPITFFLYGNGQTLSGTSPTYDPSITPGLVQHAQKLRENWEIIRGDATL
jgi:hypothetical protein